KIGRLHQIRLFQDEDLYADLTAEIVASSKPGRKSAQLTRRYHFAAAHRLHDPQRSEPDNLRLYGACGGPQAHGHNYVLHVTVAGDIDPDTGMVTHLSALDRVVQDAVLNRLDHQDLNVVPELSAVRPTGENLARFVWNRLVKAIPGGRLARVGLDETRDVSYEYAGS
ncbi:MAG: 6-carboxytetrahydropterin synthase, partial [Nitrospirales bacterium]